MSMVVTALACLLASNPAAARIGLIAENNLGVFSQHFILFVTYKWTQ
jgi:hypothetical protein